jgi:hypothetical protein
VSKHARARTFGRAKDLAASPQFACCAALAPRAAAHQIWPMGPLLFSSSVE